MGGNIIKMAITLKQYTQRLRKLIEASQTKAINSVMIPSANRLLENVKNRIINQGENTQGGKIGQYSTKPMYASKEQFDKKSAFKPLKKKYVSTDAKAPKTVKGRKVLATVFTAEGKTMYLQQGYKELRQIQGKRVDIVNLEYRGDLMRSYQQEVVNTGIIVQGLKHEKEKKKREGLQKRFGGLLLHPQKKEIEGYKEELIKNTRTLHEKIIKGG